MSDQAVLWPKWSPDGRIILTKGQLHHSYTFSPVYLFSGYPLLIKNVVSIFTHKSIFIHMYIFFLPGMGQLSFDIHLSLVVEFPQFLYRNWHIFLCHNQIVHIIHFFYYRWKIHNRHIHHYKIAGRWFLLCQQYIY